MTPTTLIAILSGIQARLRESGRPDVDVRARFVLRRETDAVHVKLGRFPALRQDLLNYQRALEDAARDLRTILRACDGGVPDSTAPTWEQHLDDVAEGRA